MSFALLPIYIADSHNHRIQQFTATGSFLSKWGSQGSDIEQFYWPAGVAVDANGDVYVAENGNNRIQKFTSTGSFIAQWGEQGSNDGQFRWSNSVSVAPDGTVYVADTDNHRIQHFSAMGQFLGKWGSQGSGDGQFNRPYGVAVAPDGMVYATDINNQRIQRFSATGQFLGKWGSEGSGDGQFDDPYGVAIAPDSTVYVADTYNHRIQRFSAAGQLLGRWGSQGSGDGQFKWPSGVAVAPDGTVYVADSGNYRIQRFSTTGDFLGKWGSQGSGDGQFGLPSGVAIAPDGTVYVVDTYNYRIQRFSATGQFLGKWGSQGSGDGQFKYPVGVAAALDGTVYVVDSGNYCIQRFSATGQFLGKWGSQGYGDGQFAYPDGVAVAPDSTVYVADTQNNRIQAFSTSFSSTWHGDYFANRWLAEASVLVHQDATIDFDWGTGSPGPSVPADNFSARWQRYIWFDAGNYRFTVSVDDGVRLWVDDKLLIEAWQDPQVATYSADISLTQGYHRVRLEYYEAAGGAAVRLRWEQITAATATPTRTHTSILFDETHDERGTLSEERARQLNPQHPEWHYFGYFQEQVSRTYQLYRHYTGDLTDQYLQGYTILILAAPNIGLSDAEIASVVRFVQSGGGLLVLGDAGLNADINRLLDHSSIEFDPIPIASPAHDWDAQSFYVNSFAPHPVTDGLGRWHTNWGGSLQVSEPALSLSWTTPDAWKDANGDGVQDPGEAVGSFTLLAAAQIGQGRVVVVADNAFHDTMFGFNTSLMMNMLAWLSQNR